jgi:hypothetical protein
VERELTLDLGVLSADALTGIGHLLVTEARHGVGSTNPAQRAILREGASRCANAANDKGTPCEFLISRILNVPK